MTYKEQLGIAFYVSNGYTEGRIDNVKWEIDIEREGVNGEVARLINEGETFGRYPNWDLKINRTD